MKRAGNLYAQWTSMEALHNAYVLARQRKRGLRACYRFERSLGAQLTALHCELGGGSYQPHPAYRFHVREPKLRLIEAPHFRDFVVQHALHSTLFPIFNRRFSSASYACRPGRGTHACADAVQRMMRSAPPGAYTLHVDVRKFFYSIDRDVLGALLERCIKCQATLRVAREFAERPEPTGVPIGHLMSQLFAGIYLDPVDRFIKRELHVRRYARYMDDLILIADSRGAAAEWREAITQFLAGHLRLAVSKAVVSPITRGVNFCGYRTWRQRRFIRPYSLRKARRAVRQGNLKRLVSILGHARHTSSYRHLLAYCQEHNHALHQALPANHRRVHDAHHHCSGIAR